MVYLLSGVDRRARNRVGGAVKAVDGTTKECVDAAHLLGREIFRDGEVGETGEGHFVAAKLHLELPGGGRERGRARRLRMEREARVIEQRAAIGLVGDST